MRASYGKISKVKLDKTELNMKDLNEKLKRKSYTHSTRLYPFFTRSTRSAPGPQLSSLFLTFTVKNF